MWGVWRVLQGVCGVLEKWGGCKVWGGAGKQGGVCGVHVGFQPPMLGCLESREQVEGSGPEELGCPSLVFRCVGRVWPSPAAPWRGWRGSGRAGPGCSPAALCPAGGRVLGCGRSAGSHCRGPCWEPPHGSWPSDVGLGPAGGSLSVGLRLVPLHSREPRAGSVAEGTVPCGHLCPSRFLTLGNAIWTCSYVSELPFRFVIW